MKEKYSILVFEIISSGHHPVYQSNIIKGISKSNFDIFTTTSSTGNSRFLIDSLKKEEVNVIFLRDGVLGRSLRKFGWLFGEFSNYLLLRKITKEIRPDIIVIPCMDYVLRAFVFFGSPFNLPWVGVQIKNPFQNVKHRVIYRFILSRIKNQLKKGSFLFTIDQGFSKIIDHDIYKNARSSYLADPVNMPCIIDRGLALGQLNLSKSCTWVLVYGAISNRKNIEILLNSIYDLESNKIGVIIAGLCDDSVLSVLLEESSKELIKDKRLVVINEYLSEKQEELVFSACDIVWMGYSGHYGMSGVLIKAVWAKRVVIACNTGLIAQFAKSTRAGPVINTEDITEIKNILLLLSSPRVRQKYISKASDSLNEHSWDSFISKVDSAIVRIINSNE